MTATMAETNARSCVNIPTSYLVAYTRLLFWTIFPLNARQLKGARQTNPFTPVSYDCQRCRARRRSPQIATDEQLASIFPRLRRDDRLRQDERLNLADTT